MHKTYTLSFGLISKRGGGEAEGGKDREEEEI